MGVMPKSNIYEPVRIGVNVETGERIEPQPRRISIGWSKDMHAQLGVGWVDPAITPEKLLSHETGRSDDYIQTGELDDSGTKVWQSQWIDMDRHTINQLIRELRRARDEAFGRDE